MFNTVYFLHIPKTGGRYLINSALYSLVRPLEANNINNMQEDYSHLGWHKDITESTYIISLFRDPVEQLVSLYSHVQVLDNLGDPRKDISDPKLTKEDMFAWLYKDEEGARNFQAKNLLRTGMVETRLSDIKLTSRLEVEPRLKRVNLLIRTTTLDVIDFRVIVDKICDDLSINRITNYQRVHKSSFKNPESKKLLLSLTESDKEELKKFSSIDVDIYNDDSLFWTPK